MNRSELLKKVTETLADIVDDDALELSENTTPEDVPDWDSINHMKLIITLETEFNIRFEAEEINTVENVRGLLDMIESRI
jgi:acyl carrier protein